MPKKEDEEIIRVHVWVYKSDWELMRTIFGRHNNVTPSNAIRQILRSHLTQIKARVDSVKDRITKIEL
jgi:hypothetical protein